MGGILVMGDDFEMVGAGGGGGYPFTDFVLVWMFQKGFV